MPGCASLSAFAFASASAVFVVGSSVLPSGSGMSVPVPGLSAFLSSALPSLSGVSVPILGSLAPLSVSFMSGVSVPMPRLSAPWFVSGVPVPEPRLSPPPFLIWSNPQTPTSAPKRQKLSQWSGILKRASSEEASTTWAPLFPLSEHSSPFFFPSSGIGKKRPFDRAFIINCWPLADEYVRKDVDQRKFDKTFINTWLLPNNHVEEQVDLSFAECGCSPGVKLNRPW